MHVFLFPPWSQIVAVAAGSAMGGVLRFVTLLIIQRLWGTSFPLGTMIVNIVGSFLMGMLTIWIMSRTSFSDTVRLMLTTGMLGGFTTFSTFSLDAILLVEKGEMVAFGVYAGLSVGLSLLAVLAGIVMARWVFVSI